MHTNNGFKGIVVGGGPVGLTAAHALGRANIDFVLLESRPSPVVDAGGSLVLLPMGLRTFDQLGLRSSLDQVSSSLGHIYRQDHLGQDIGEALWFQLIKQSFGSAPAVLSRHDLTKVLYDTLPETSQSKIIPNSKVSNITTNENGVEVTCADGSSYQGSIVIGADGAHSIVRQQMRNLALNANSEQVNDEKPYLTTFQALWLRMPTSVTGLEAGVTSETHGPNAATQLFSAEDTTVLGLYEKLDKPTRERVRFTKDDEAALVERWGHLPLVPGGKLSLKEAFAARTESGLVSLEEGVVDHWSYDGRIVLTGDAAHKFTPSTGSGCNNGIVDVVALTNELYTAVQKANGATPSKAQLTEAFESYQASRKAPVTDACQRSGQATATATWQTGLHKFMDKYVLASQYVQKFISSRGGSKGAETKMGFLESGESLSEKMPWEKPEQTMPTRVI
ncbi:Zeaxanthin epoxidase chloroplastic [Fusarium albosuccineum]|uniref:Zeaxanthin epoxidase chloroplastic n=1 Tax=Fusarium albosuccineum TaxID=1237068 RepID=A0A8H4LKW3_9HYPO|nr:Zeaxanthin epoxidase chloroplastic [Fusarium albosuccineum]